MGATRDRIEDDEPAAVASWPPTNSRSMRRPTSAMIRSMRRPMSTALCDASRRAALSKVSAHERYVKYVKALSGTTERSTKAMMRRVRSDISRPCRWSIPAT